jgi:hypothetical protein
MKFMLIAFEGSRCSLSALAAEVTP